MRQGRLDEAAVEIEKALALDPLSLQNNRARGQILSRQRRYDEAIESHKRTLEIHPTSTAVLRDLVTTYWWKGAYEEALVVSEQLDSVQGTPNSPGTVFSRHLASGNRREAIGVLEGGTNIMGRATRYARLGEKEQTLQALKSAVDQHFSMAPMVSSDPNFDFIRDDPRFQDLLRRMNLEP